MQRIKFLILALLLSFSPFVLSSCDMKDVRETIEFVDSITEFFNDFKEGLQNENDKESGSLNPKKSKQKSSQTKDLLEGMEVHFIDVGQGDSAFIKINDTNILIDAGDWTGNEVVPYLKEQRVEGLDLIVGSHEHADHIGQLDKVIHEFGAEEVWLPGNSHTSKVYERVLSAIENSGANYQEVRAGEVYHVDDLVIEILHPNELTGDYNEDSIVMKVVYEDISFLFTGDAEGGAEETILNSYPSSDLTSTILKVGHHGSNTSSSDAFIRAINPELAIISVGEDNKYGHPHKDVLNRLNQANIEYHTTSSHGNIIFKTDGKNYQVEFQKE